LIPEDHRNFESLDNLVRMVRSFRGIVGVLMALPVFIYWTVGSSAKLVNRTMHQREVFYAILAISFFWTIGAVLFIQFPPLAKNVLFASKEVASLFLVIFSVGVATGSVAINALLKGDVSARYAPISVLAMGAFVAVFWFLCHEWSADVTSTRADERRPVPRAAARRADHADAAADRHSRRHVRGAALRVPDHQVRSRRRPRAWWRRTTSSIRARWSLGSLIAVGLSAAESRSSSRCC
jgi:hypothetical protein